MGVNKEGWCSTECEAWDAEDEVANLKRQVQQLLCENETLKSQLKGESVTGPAKAQRAPEALSGSQIETALSLFRRYDLDSSGKIDTPDELDQLVTNLLYRTGADRST